ncbi:LptF/LptG family permease [Ichthyenterobacterium magnum]|uniref:Lipopolysaccharide export system permease protein n=1 Tax=Ichthyenterobacterium magnum TaxID=1230530 RepID=A0A420DL26_9FLAO|nr:LptF/LptG family permease [Ichthyenterobacterium magnum]RKE94895.1 lipopolysaccharide export system permease protein [Ichthyenterobacterium magnum]
MKILDRYILTTYLKTFLSVFVILMLIFVLQAVWLYISELAGKDLALSVILKFLLYVTPTLIPLILPLTILLASIMVFGSFSENYEFAAMKSTGISLQRAMRSLSLFIVLLGILTFIFSNNVIPWANYNFYNLRKNIAKVQPAMAIAEGQFNEIGNYNIKVAKKSGERGEFFDTVVIHKKAAKTPVNRTVIVSKTGELISSEKSNILQLKLIDGNYYDEIFRKAPKERQKKPHVKSYFKEYVINVDLEGLNKVSDDKNYDNRFNMLDVNGLNYSIDSLYNKKSNELKDLSKVLYNRTSFSILNTNVESKTTDSVFNGSLLSLFNVKTNVQLLNLASNTVNSTKQILTTKKKNAKISTKTLNKHIISLHEKYVLGIACIILFFVGAPLGALIRKGGIGLPLVIAILLFLTYHFIGIFAKNSSHDGTFNPVIATWLSTLIMLPLSIFLTKRATKDRGLFEFDSYLEPIKKFLKIKKKGTLVYNDTIINLSNLKGFNNDKLVSIIKNPKAYNYPVGIKNIAYNILLNRELNDDNLEAKGLEINSNYKQSKIIANDLFDYSRFSLIFFSISVILLVLHFIFKNNKLPELASAVLDLSLISLFIYVCYFITTYIKVTLFYKNLNIKTKPIQQILFFLGFPFYAISHFFIKNKIKEDLALSCAENIK